MLKPKVFGKHEHKWFFLQTRTESVQVNPGNSDLFRKVEYSYFICNNCPDEDGGPNVIKKEVKISHVKT
jgi:hypothetical protein